MNAIPALDDKIVQINKWALAFCKLAQLEATHQNVNIVSVKLRAMLADVGTQDEAALVQATAEATQSLDKWQAAFRCVTQASYPAWWKEYQRLYALDWYAGVRLQAKRLGW